MPNGPGESRRVRMIPHGAMLLRPYALRVQVRAQRRTGQFPSRSRTGCKAAPVGRKGGAGNAAVGDQSVCCAEALGVILRVQFTASICSVMDTAPQPDQYPGGQCFPVLECSRLRRPARPRTVARRDQARASTKAGAPPATPPPASAGYPSPANSCNSDGRLGPRPLGS